MLTHSPQIPSLKQIRAVSALAETQSVVKAADRLNMSQAAFTRCIAAAEEAVGAQLFQRSWFGTDVTIQGGVVAIHFRRVLALIHQFERSELGNRDGPLRLPIYLQWSHLDAIFAVFRTGSASAAGRELGISQPAISRSLAGIGEFVGRPLFKRRPDGLDATPLAVKFAALWGDIYRELSNLPAQMEPTADNLIGRVAVGLLPFSDQDLVLRAFGEMARQHPNVRLQAVTASPPALTDGLMMRDLDLFIGLLGRPVPQTQFDVRKLYSERFTLVARRDHPCHAGPVTIEALSRFQWMAPHATPTRRCFDTLFGDGSVPPPRPMIETNSLAMAEEFLASSHAIGILHYTPFALSRLRPDLKPLEFDLPDPDIAVGTTMRKGEDVSAPVKQFLAVLNDQIEARGLV